VFVFITSPCPLLKERVDDGFGLLTRIGATNRNLIIGKVVSIFVS
jgi:hypothetical protein